MSVARQAIKKTCIRKGLKIISLIHYPGPIFDDMAGWELTVSFPEDNPYTIGYNGYSYKEVIADIELGWEDKP